MNGRANLINPSWREELHQYIAGIIRSKSQKSIIVGGTADHVHAFFNLKPSLCPADLIRDIKCNSSKWINERGFVLGHFSWQEGYGVFSYAQSQVENVYNYIKNQEEHHKKKTFREEYLDFLKKFDVPYEDRFLFDWVE